MILDGKIVAAALENEIQAEVEQLRQQLGRPPGLAVVLVGQDPASQIYVASKSKLAERLGIHSRVSEFPSDLAGDMLRQAIMALNNDEEVDAILLQLPLPEALNVWEFLELIDPAKDADRIHPFNQGLIFLNRSELFPCTPAGVMRLLDHYGIALSGMRAAMIGRSLLVGKPLAQMLSNRNATVTICHSRTRDLAAILGDAELIVAAVGKPGCITADMIRPGAVLIDVGINRLCDGEEVQKNCSPAQQEKFKKTGHALCGDIQYAAYAKAAHYTPVPGGVGPMTVTMLMHNTVKLCRRRFSDG